jgi:hypothetical protein
MRNKIMDRFFSNSFSFLRKFRVFHLKIRKNKVIGEDRRTYHSTQLSILIQNLMLLLHKREGLNEKIENYEPNSDFFASYLEKRNFLSSEKRSDPYFCCESNGL